MKTLQEVFTKAKPIIAKILFVVFFLFCGAFILRTCQEFKKAPVSQNLQIKPTTSYIDKTGNKHEVIVIKQLSQKELDHITDSIRKTIKGTPQIKEVIKIVPKIDTYWKELPIVEKKDTLETSKIDNYVNVKAIINLKTKQGFISLSLIDTLTQVKTFKNRFLRSAEHTLDITNTNPYVNVVAGSVIMVKEPKSLIVLGPSIIYNPFTQKMQYGIGLTFNVLSIKSRR